MLEFTTAEAAANGRKRTLEKAEFVMVHLRAVHVFYAFTSSQLLCLHAFPHKIYSGFRIKKTVQPIHQGKGRTIKS